MNASSITGLVLAGGRGARMDGLDKGWQTLRGEALVVHVLRRLQTQVGTCLISANRNREAYASLGLPVLPDLIDGYAGPLAGLQAGLKRCATPFLLTAPCDAPFFPLDLAARLGEALEREQAEAAMATCGGRPQPVFCLVRQSVAPRLDDYLASGNRKFELWIASLKSAQVEFADAAAFANINSPEDLRRHSG